MRHSEADHFTIRSGMTVYDLKQLTARREWEVAQQKMVEHWVCQREKAKYWEKVLTGEKHGTECEKVMCMDPTLKNERKCIDSGVSSRLLLGVDVASSDSQESLLVEYSVSGTDFDVVFITAGGQLVALLNGVANVPVIPMSDFVCKKT